MNTNTTELTSLQQSLAHFDKHLGPIPVSTTYFKLTPELLATARPYGSDELGYDISAYPSHVGMTAEQIKDCELRTVKCDDGDCEAITIVGHLNFDGKNPSGFPTWDIAASFIEALKKGEQFIDAAKRLIAFPEEATMFKYAPDDRVPEHFLAGITDAARASWLLARGQLGNQFVDVVKRLIAFAEEAKKIPSPVPEPFFSAIAAAETASRLLDDIR